ncbi:MAG: hypothetical protein ABFD54_15060 [Armatimonadota bacterium]|nr:hypothetical protein [bacterium]
MIKTVTLREPVTFEGKEIEVLSIDTGKINGRLMRRVEGILSGQGSFTVNGQFSNAYCAYCGVIAAGHPQELLDELSGPDYMEVSTLVQGFLLGVDMPEETLLSETPK